MSSREQETDRTSTRASTGSSCAIEVSGVLYEVLRLFCAYVHGTTPGGSWISRISRIPKRRQSFFWSCTNARNVRDAEEDCGGGVLGKDLNTTAVGRGDRLAASCAALRLLEQDIHRINMTSSEGDKCASHEFD